MKLNLYGKIAYNEWAKLSERFSNFQLDVFQIMPNHMHGIIVLNDEVIKTAASTGPTYIAPISGIVGAYKSLVANQILEIFKLHDRTMGKLWQRNYYEHIIRNEQAYQNISNYISNNPAKWKEDTFFT